MEISKKYFSKYLHDIAVEQIADDYTNKGYDVSREVLLGDYHADLVAKKGNEQIVIEIKSGKMTADTKSKMAGLANYVRSIGGYKFMVVVASPPKEKKLRINNIDQLIFNYIHSDLNSKLHSLSTRTRPNEVKDIDLEEMSISGKSILIKGKGVISAELQFGSDSDNANDDGYKTIDNFPFTFDMTLENGENNSLKIVEVRTFEVDTSDY